MVHTRSLTGRPVRTPRGAPSRGRTAPVATPPGRLTSGRAGGVGLLCGVGCGPAHAGICRALLRRGCCRSMVDLEAPQACAPSQAACGSCPTIRAVSRIVCTIRSWLPRPWGQPRAGNAPDESEASGCLASMTRGTFLENSNKIWSAWEAAARRSAEPRRPDDPTMIRKKQ